ncbi:MAG: YfhO family protein, partial [Flavobacteriales bacterium]
VAIAVGAIVRGAMQSKLPQTLRAVGLLAAAGLVAALPQTSQLALTEQYAQFTTRGEAVLTTPSEGGGRQEQAGLDREYILEYSMSRGEFWSMAVPDVKGGNNQLYWGEQRFSGGAFYFGALAFALCLAWFIAGSHWLRWPLLAVSLLAIVLSWRDATWLTDVFLERVPLFNKFRDTKMMLVLLQMIVPVGAAMALHEVQSDRAAKQWKRWVGAGAASAVLMALFYVLPDTLFDFKSSLRPDMAMEQLGNRVKGMRLEVFRADVLRALGLSLLGLGVVLALVKRWVDARWVVMGTVVVVALDMASVNNRYLGPNNYESVMDKRFPFEATPADRAILAAERAGVSDFDEQFKAAQARWEDRLDTKLTRRYARAQDAAAFEVLNANTHHRVFDLANPFNDARTSYFHKSVGGYHGAKLRRYQDFIERVLTPERAAIIAQIQAGQFQLGVDVAPGLAMLNTKYMLVPGAEQPLPFAGGLGPAWFVDDVTWVGSAEEEIAGIAGLNPAAQAVVHTEFQEVLGRVNAPGASEVALEAYHPEGSSYKVNSQRGGLLVLSEVHYPVGWTAMVDGEEVPLVRVNYILSGLNVPAGAHDVQLTFKPEGWDTAKMLSRAGSLLLAALLGLSIRFGSRESEG